MGVIEQSGLLDDDPVGCPLIGYDNQVTASNVSSSSSDADFPITNVANPATHLKWKGGVNLTVLLHFDGSDGATVISDGTGNGQVWTANGNAQLDTAQAKFGPSSLLCDGTTDFVSTPDDDAFTFGSSDLTIDFWARPADVTSIGVSAHRTDNNNNWRFRIPAGSTWDFRVTSGGVDLVSMNGGTATINTWQHVAVTRSGSNWRLFVDGVIVATATYAGAVPDFTGLLYVGSNQQDASDYNGHIDEFHIVKYAIWTAAFTPPTIAHDGLTKEEITVALTGAMNYVAVAKHNWFSLGFHLISLAIDDGGGYVDVFTNETFTNDDPIIFRLIDHSPNSPSISSMRISISYDGASGTKPEAAVIYVGELLVLERSIDIGSGHVPITYGRRSNIVNGMSETGNFLGRIVVGEYRQSKAEFKWLTDTFYRSDIDAFLAAAQEIPFFWAWSPEEYPLEVGYVWLTNDAEPEVDPVTRRIALELEMRGIA